MQNKGNVKMCFLGSTRVPCTVQCVTFLFRDITHYCSFLALKVLFGIGDDGKYRADETSGHQGNILHCVLNRMRLKASLLILLLKIIHLAVSLRQTSLMKLPLPTLPAGQKRLYIVRHGQTDWNVQGRIQGGTDVPLNEYGRWQAAQTGLALAGAPLDVIASSDLDRAFDTADTIWGYHASSGKSKRIVTNKLAEMRFGMWEGQLVRHSTSSSSSADFDHVAAMINRDASLAWPNGGESTLDVQQRIDHALRQILQAGNHVCCVAHGRFNRILLEYLMGTRQPEQENASISVIDYDPNAEEWMLQLCNYKEHLEQWD
jgi:broad specificity phosphatase PhoE